MSICDDRGKDDGRQIVVSLSGIPKMYSNDISTARHRPRGHRAIISIHINK